MVLHFMLVRPNSKQMRLYNSFLAHLQRIVGKGKTGIITGIILVSIPGCIFYLEKRNARYMHTQIHVLWFIVWMNDCYSLDLK